MTSHVQTETKKAVFWNSTIIEPAAWELHGVSSKDDPNTAIGRFGTGACYYIAVLLRTGHKLSIKAGEQWYHFGLVDMEFRGKEFKRVTCNGKELSFTTHYGINWTVDQAYREVYANCVDEGGIHFVGEPMEEGTSVVIEGDGILDSMSRHEEIFLGSREPIAETNSVRIYQGAGTIYFRGVKVGSVENAMFSYEMLGELELTEDRSIKHQYRIPQEIGRIACCTLQDKAIIRRILTAPESRWEHEIDFEWTSWSNEFTEVATDLWKNSPTKLNQKVFRLLRKKVKDIGWEAREIDEDKEIMLEKAKDFLKRAGYEVTAPIKLVDNDDHNTIAFYFNDTIHLTNKSFEEGMFHLVRVLMEENFHAWGYSDACRGFEDFLQKELIKQASKRLKETL